MAVRPRFHFTPKKGWMNDPNGLVFYQGKYHLFYQHNPYSCEWDSMHWGHAVSEDLLFWEHLPIALAPDEYGDIFSGSCIVDTECISPFGTKGKPALLAFYTSHHPVTLREEQCLAVSTDGVNFEKYKGNPIIPGLPFAPARDPYVFKNPVLGGCTMCLTTEDRICFFHSADLIHWEKSSEFTLPPFAIQGMIECPCMIHFPGTEDKWVLMMSMVIAEQEYVKFPENVGKHPRFMQYLVGDFDGKVFTPCQDNKKPLFVDEGEDFYAGSIFSNLPEPVMMAWLGDSENSRRIPMEKEGFRGIMSYPRKLSLVKREGQYQLKHSFFPIPADNSLSIRDRCVSETISEDGLHAKTLLTAENS